MKLREKSKHMAEERFLSIPLNEQETTISFSRDSEQVDIWTNDRTMITKLDKLCKSSPAMYRCKHVGYSTREHEVMDKQYVCSDKSLLSFKPKKRQCAPLTDEQKAERVQRLRALQNTNGVR